MCGSQYNHNPMSEDDAERTLECRIASRTISLGKTLELAFVPFSVLANVSEAYNVMERAGRSFPPAHKIRMYTSAALLDCAKFAAIGYALYNAFTRTQ